MIDKSCLRFFPYALLSTDFLLTEYLYYCYVFLYYNHCWCHLPRKIKLFLWPRSSPKLESINSSSSIRSTTFWRNTGICTFLPSTIWAPITSKLSESPWLIPSSLWERTRSLELPLELMRKTPSSRTPIGSHRISRDTALSSSPIRTKKNVRRYSISLKRKSTQLEVPLPRRLSFWRKDSIVWRNSDIQWSHSWDNSDCQQDWWTLKSSCSAITYSQRKESLWLLKNAKSWSFWTRKCLD